MDNERKEMKARYQMFDRFALKDQKSYYENAINANRQSATQVNRYRALFALLTGLSAAAAGVIIQTNPVNTEFALSLAGFFAILAVVMPALGAAFSTLADLYQWDKLVTIYEAALDNLEVADALSPTPSITDDDVYRASARAFAEGTLAVMSDESAQWGQSIRTPAQLAEFVQQERDRTERRRGNSTTGPGTS